MIILNQASNSLTLKRLAQRLNSRIHGGAVTVDEPMPFSGVSIDSRTIKPGELFVAIEGPQFDGHNFVKHAQQQGAVAAVVARRLDAVTLPCLLVNDTNDALSKIGQLYRETVTIPTVGLTGSCGKTTTKQLLASIFSQVGTVVASVGSLNNQYGVPLTLARLNATTDFAVIEMGANHPGEIAALTQQVRPTVALITNASMAHLAGFINVEGVARAKGEIFAGLGKAGTAILNADDPQVAYWRTLVRDHRVITFGLLNPADVTAKHCVIDDSTGMPSFILSAPPHEIPVSLPLMGKHNVANALGCRCRCIGRGHSSDGDQSRLRSCATRRPATGTTDRLSRSDDY